MVIQLVHRSKRSTSKMSFAINALLSESEDEDEELLSDATQLLEEDEGAKKTGGSYSFTPQRHEKENPKIPTLL